MFQRSRFLPTISNGLACSMFQNARSPSLKEKLLKLLALGKLKFQDESTFDDDTLESQQKPPNVDQELIAKTINESLWRGMQKTLYDSLAARQLKYFEFGREEIAKDVMLEEELCQPHRCALTE